jgi:hypothetical protein
MFTVSDGPHRAAFPRLEAYLAAVPGGLDGHPQCLAKGALVRNAFEDRPELRGRAGELPHGLGHFLVEPPLAGEWIPEVHFVALFHALNDLLALDDAGVLARARSRNRALFDSPTYRILMAVLSPMSLLRFAGKRWDTFHRGSELEVSGASDDGVRVRVSFPPGLFDPLVLAAFGTAFAAALDLSGARGPLVTLERVDPGAGHFRAVWG